MPRTAVKERGEVCRLPSHGSGTVDGRAARRGEGCGDFFDDLVRPASDLRPGADKE